MTNPSQVKKSSQVKKPAESSSSSGSGSSSSGSGSGTTSSSDKGANNASRKSKSIQNPSKPYSSFQSTKAVSQNPSQKSKSIQNPSKPYSTFESSKATSHYPSQKSEWIQNPSKPYSTFESSKAVSQYPSQKSKWIQKPSKPYSTFESSRAVSKYTSQRSQGIQNPSKPYSTFESSRVVSQYPSQRSQGIQNPSKPYSTFESSRVVSQYPSQYPTKTASHQTHPSTTAYSQHSSTHQPTKATSHPASTHAPTKKTGDGDADCCCDCNGPVLAVYKPGFGCYEKVNGPFQNPIPTPYDDYLQKYCHVRKPPVPRFRNGRNQGRGSWPNNKTCCQGPPPCPPYLRTMAICSGAGPGRGGPKCMKSCCDNKQTKLCQAELQRLREERWKEQERKNLLEEKRRREWADQQYMTQMRQWELAQEKCVKDQERRECLLQQIKLQRKEMKKLREEAKQWRRYQKKLFLEQREREESNWVQEFSQREDERRWEQEKIRMIQEDKWLCSQMRTHDSTNMAVPELEELRRMFVPVQRGPNETFEYFLVEPRPTSAELRKTAQMKMEALLGLRNQNGIHLDLSDRCKKKTTIELAMGPRCANGDRDTCCNVITQPGASCCTEKTSPCCSQQLPNVPVPKFLSPLMQTLSYRVKEMNSPLLRMEGYGPGPHFGGARLYGTVVLPKGNHLSSLYTDPYCVTF